MCNVQAWSTAHIVTVDILQLPREPRCFSSGDHMLCFQGSPAPLSLRVDAHKVSCSIRAPARMSRIQLELVELMWFLLTMLFSYQVSWLQHSPRWHADTRYWVTPLGAEKQNCQGNDMCVQIKKNKSDPRCRFSWIWLHSFCEHLTHRRPFVQHANATLGKTTFSSRCVTYTYFISWTVNQMDGVTHFLLHKSNLFLCNCTCIKWKQIYLFNTRNNNHLIKPSIGVYIFKMLLTSFSFFQCLQRLGYREVIDDLKWKATSTEKYRSAVIQWRRVYRISIVKASTYGQSCGRVFIVICYNREGLF